MSHRSSLWSFFTYHVHEIRGRSRHGQAGHPPPHHGQKIGASHDCEKQSALDMGIGGELSLKSFTFDKSGQKAFSFRGFAPLTTWGAPPPDPVIGSRSALAMVCPTLANPRSAPAQNNHKIKCSNMMSWLSCRKTDQAKKLKVWTHKQLPWTYQMKAV